MEWVARLLRATGILVGLLCVAAPGTALARVDAQPCIARLHKGESAEAVRHQPARFDCRTRQNTLGPGDFLVEERLAPIANKPGNPLKLRMASVWQDKAKIDFVYADGFTSSLTYTSADAPRYLTMGAIFEFPIPEHQAPLKHVYVEVRGSANVRGIVLDSHLLTRDESNAFQLRLTAIYAAFGGMVLALLVYNLSLWMALRHRFQLLYCAMVASLGAYTFSTSGALALVAPWLDNNWRLSLNLFLLALSGATALHFIKGFFETAVFGPWLRKAVFATSAASIGSALLFAMFAPRFIGVFDRIYIYSMTAMLSMVVPILVSAWRRRSRYFWLFVLAWAAPIFASVARAAHGFGFIEYSFWLDNGNTMAMAVEALMSSLMVTARVRELTMERDDALAGEQVARRLAATDPLTGLLNRRAFIEMAIGRKSRHRLMLIDIDHFKAVNDRFGHDAGDEVLSEVASVIQRIRPAKSLAVRLGGEEFALLIPRSHFADCSAEDVLEAIREHTMPRGANVTVSVGYADGGLATEEDWKRLYRVADAALYRAKSDGRDRACRATDFRVAA
jgi:diguanylate cyclase (GGDEF)-like protein